MYIAAERNFNKIWKVSIENETIETFKGFEKPMKLHVKGLRLSELKKLASYNNKTIAALNEKFIIKPVPGQQTEVQVSGISGRLLQGLAIPVVLILMVFTVVILKKKHESKV